MQMKLLCVGRTFPCSERLTLKSCSQQIYLLSKVMLGIKLFLKQKVIEFHYPHISLKLNVFALNL